MKNKHLLYKGTSQSNKFILDKEEDSGAYRGYAVFFYDFGGNRLVWRVEQNDGHSV